MQLSSVMTTQSNRRRVQGAQLGCKAQNPPVRVGNILSPFRVIFIFQSIVGTKQMLSWLDSVCREFMV